MRLSVYSTGRTGLLSIQNFSDSVAHLQTSASYDVHDISEELADNDAPVFLGGFAQKREPLGLWLQHGIAIPCYWDKVAGRSPWIKLIGVARYNGWPLLNGICVANVMGVAGGRRIQVTGQKTEAS